MMRKDIFMESMNKKMVHYIRVVGIMAKNLDTVLEHNSYLSRMLNLSGWVNFLRAMEKRQS